MPIKHTMKHTIGRIVASAILPIAFGLGTGTATAGWQFVGDVDTTDTATNPGYPANQSASTVGAYLQDLLNLDDPPEFLGGEDSYGGAPLTGLGNPGSGKQFLLAFHFGNGNRYWEHTGTFDVFFACTAQCDNFTLPNTQGISNYRLYDPPTGELAVPEPESLALFGAGLVVLFASRRHAGRDRTHRR